MIGCLRDTGSTYSLKRRIRRAIYWISYRGSTNMALTRWTRKSTRGCTAMFKKVHNLAVNTSQIRKRKCDGNSQKKIHFQETELCRVVRSVIRWIVLVGLIQLSRDHGKSNQTHCKPNTAAWRQPTFKHTLTRIGGIEVDGHVGLECVVVHWVATVWAAELCKENTRRLEILIAYAVAILPSRFRRGHYLIKLAGCRHRDDFTGRLFPIDTLRVLQRLEAG